MKEAREDPSQTEQHALEKEAHTAAPEGLLLNEALEALLPLPTLLTLAALASPALSS